MSRPCCLGKQAVGPEVTRNKVTTGQQSSCATAEIAFPVLGGHPNEPLNRGSPFHFSDKPGAEYHTLTFPWKPFRKSSFVIGSLLRIGVLALDQTVLEPLLVIIISSQQGFPLCKASILITYLVRSPSLQMPGSRCAGTVPTKPLIGSAHRIPELAHTEKLCVVTHAHVNAE
jgi:hypothetical protein